jgi:hypothetical protein
MRYNGIKCTTLLDKHPNPVRPNRVLVTFNAGHNHFVYLEDDDLVILSIDLSSHGHHFPRAELCVTFQPCNVELSRTFSDFPIAGSKAHTSLPILLLERLNCLP